MFFSRPLFSQDYYLEFRGSPNDLEVVEKYNLNKKSADSSYLISQLNSLEAHLQQEGYLGVEINTLWKDSAHLQADVNLGSRYQLVTLEPGNVDPVLLQKIGYKQRLFHNRPFHYMEVGNLMEKLIDHSGNSGYPFASVKLDSVQVRDTEIRARLLFDPGPLITFDSIELEQPVRINHKFIQAYLRIVPGTPFCESVIEEVASRIGKLPYLRLTEDPRLTFQNDQATTHLSLQSVKSNQIDGVIGFLPNAREDGNLLLTGQFNLMLQNVFGSGRTLDFQWESFKPESQLLNINFYQPILFRSPIDLSLGFHLFKEDSSFVNRIFNLDLGYSHRKRHFIGIHTLVKASRLPASNLLDDAVTFPDLADFNLTQFGGTYKWDNLDNYISPKSGYQIGLQASAGIKKIKRNSAINDSLYQDLDFETNQFSWEAKFQGYFHLSKHWVISSQWMGGGIYNERLFFNDLFRLGGLKSLRGFSENTFFADNYSYSSIEPRFFFDTDSYLFVFYDQAWWLKYALENTRFKDTPSGFGAGISLSAGAGIFNFVWGVGNSNTQKIGFDQSKIHFGYISRF